jgi:c-di-GMP-binding flagellar brake protein YcgR
MEHREDEKRQNFRVDGVLTIVWEKVGKSLPLHKPTITPNEETAGSEPPEIEGEPKEVNISEGGIRFKTRESVEIGDVLEISILLPMHLPMKLVTYGTVVRVEERDKGEYEIALHFADMDDDVRGGIFRYVFDRQREIIRKERQDKEGE